jgi:hypothetical protein
VSDAAAVTDAAAAAEFPVASAAFYAADAAYRAALVLDGAAHAADYASQAAVSCSAAVEYAAGCAAVCHARETQCLIVHSVLGTPYKKGQRLPPDLLTPDVLSLAQRIFDAGINEDGTLVEAQGLPVMADALDEAGCREDLLLEHLRTQGPHYQGAWSFELITSEFGP